MSETREPETWHLFGPERHGVGWPQHEWSVWVFGPDDILPQPDLRTALEVAALINAEAVESVQSEPHDGLTPHHYAVVLNGEYAWHPGTERVRELEESLGEVE